MDDILAQLRQHINHPAMKARTHWNGCIDSHPTCALAWALDEVERLRDENERLGESLENAMRLLAKKEFEARHV